MLEISEIDDKKNFSSNCFWSSQDFEALQGRADGKTAFYEALSRSLGGATGSDVLKEAAAWFYSLDHSPSAAGYNLFSRALNNATRSEPTLTPCDETHSDRQPDLDGQAAQPITAGRHWLGLRCDSSDMKDPTKPKIRK